MKSIISLVLGISVLLIFAFNVSAGQLDPYWKIQRDMKAKAAGVEKGVGAEIMIDVFIKSADTTKTEQQVLSVGGEVRTVVGSIMTASLPSDVIEQAAEWPEVQYIEAGKPVYPMNDLADADTGVTAVHAGTNLPHGYDGTGVIVGVIDSGIDLTHPAFKDESGESRVLYVWDQQDATGPGPAEISSTYGTEYKHAAIMAGGIAQNDTSGHGTHVAGTAAGLDDTYPGVAPNANLIIVKADLSLDDDFFSPGVCDATNYIFQKASYLVLPAVINMSIGSNYGSHDGTSLFEQCLDGLVGDAAGRAIAVSAGNSADLQGLTTIGNHIGYSVTAAQNVGSSFYPLSNPYPSPYILEIWEAADCTEKLEIGLWQSGVGLISRSNEIDVGNSETAAWGPMVYSIDRTEAPSSINGKVHSLIAIYPDELFDPNNYFFDVVFSGNCSALDAWTEQYSTHYFGADSGIIFGIEYHPGNSVSTVSSPATAANVITVGAHVTRTSWTDSGGATESDPLGLLTTIGDLAYFSSRGPALNSAQGQKPNVTAPGAYTISAYSSDTASPEPTEQIDDTHYAMNGTSMAAPHVTGIVALMLQAYPSLTYDQIISYLQSTARTDDYVGDVPNDDWGYGKVDAAAAVAAVTAEYPPEDSDGDFSGITITGLSDDGSVSKDTKDFVVNFPREALDSTCTTDNIFIAPSSGASASMSKGAWDESECDSGSALPASVSMGSSTELTLTLSNQIGEGNFIFCISPSVRDSEEIMFGGKTLQFSATSSGGGGGGCELAQTSRASSVMGMALMCAALATVSILRRRDNRKFGIV